MQQHDEGVRDRAGRYDVPTVLEMDEVAPDLFRSRHNQRNIKQTLFGGQIVAQALVAADRTVPGRTVHSLHSYFLRAGTDRAPVDYRVARTRDGGRFSTRRVEAVQGGQTLFVMDASYRTPITGFSHYRACPIPFDPDAAIDQDALAALTLANGQHFGGLLKHHYPVELRIPGVEGFLERRAEAKRHYWLRAKGADRIADAAGQRQILAFLSDFLFAGAPLTRHTVALPGPHLFVASLDHNIWFHRDVRCDDWLLFETDGPNAENGVNLARGMIYNRAGELVASIAQEALQYPVGDAD